MKSARDLKTAANLSLNSGDRRTYIGQLKDAQSERLYRIRCKQSGSLNLSLTHLQSNADLTLLNSKGKALKRSDKAGSAKEMLKQTVKQGVYYVRVSSQQGKTQYRLNLAVEAAQSDNQPAATGNSAFVQRVVDLTNAQRTQAGLQPLKFNAKLSAAAYAHSRDMALNDFFNHTGSDGSRAADRILTAGYKYLNAGENIAAGYATPEAVVEGWMNSPGHRANILHSRVKEIGVGFYFLPNDVGQAPYQYYWTQDFATPAR